MVLLLLIRRNWVRFAKLQLRCFFTRKKLTFLFPNPNSKTSCTFCICFFMLPFQVNFVLQILQGGFSRVITPQKCLQKCLMWLLPYQFANWKQIRIDERRTESKRRLSYSNMMAFETFKRLCNNFKSNVINIIVSYFTSFTNN